LKAELLDDPCHAAFTDREACLSELLSDHIGRGVRIEKTVTDYLALDFIGANVVSLGPALLGLKRQGALLLKEIEHLIITLPSEAIAFGRRGSAKLAFSLDEHEQAWGDLIDRRDDELATGAADPAVRQVKDHGRLLQPDEVQGAGHPAARVGG
jgi:hypothetical protein